MCRGLMLLYVYDHCYTYMYLQLCSGATRGCAWRMGLAHRVWMEAGVCGLPGRSAAGHVEVASPLLSDTATAPGTELSFT